MIDVVRPRRYAPARHFRRLTKGVQVTGTTALLIGVYFVPTLVAWVRLVPNAMSTTIVNLFLGWTIIGWIVALAMAARTVPPRTTS